MTVLDNSLARPPAPPETPAYGPRRARRPLSLRGNFSWSLAGNVVYAACQWGMLMAITRLGSPEMLGQFALGLAVTTPLLAFANLKAKGVQASDARREYHFRGNDQAHVHGYFDSLWAV